jgi:hypothetical protein
LQAFVGELAGLGGLLLVGDGFEEEVAGFEGFFVDGGGFDDVEKAPFFALLHEAHDAAPGEFEGEDVGFVAFGEAGGFEHDAAEVFHFPEEREGGRAGGAFAADDFAVGIGELATDRDGVRANQVGGGEVKVRRGDGGAFFKNAESQHERVLAKDRRDYREDGGAGIGGRVSSFIEFRVCGGTACKKW